MNFYINVLKKKNTKIHQYNIITDQNQLLYQTMFN